MAKLYFYYSAMNAGKTTKLLQNNFNYIERGMKTVLYTFAGDNRYGTAKITSRIGLSSDANVFDSNTKLFNEISELSNSNNEKIACLYRIKMLIAVIITGKGQKCIMHRILCRRNITQNLIRIVIHKVLIGLIDFFKALSVMGIVDHSHID